MNKPIYIKVRANVRYWEDASVNDVEDINGNLIPCRNGDNWEPTIRLDDGFIVDWPQGNSADIHYKVCDAGEYWLLDDNKNTVAKWNGFYVPDDFLSQGGEGFGDYIILKVSKNGFVQDWKRPAIILAKNDEDQSGWKEI